MTRDKQDAGGIAGAYAGAKQLVAAKCTLCGHESPYCTDVSAENAYRCTREAGHLGDHAGCGTDPDEHPIERWSASAAAALEVRRDLDDPRRRRNVDEPLAVPPLEVPAVGLDAIEREERVADGELQVGEDGARRAAHPHVEEAAGPQFQGAEAEELGPEVVQEGLLARGCVGEDGDGLGALGGAVYERAHGGGLSGEGPHGTLDACEADAQASGSGDSDPGAAFSSPAGGDSPTGAEDQSLRDLAEFAQEMAREDARARELLFRIWLLAKVPGVRGMANAHRSFRGSAENEAVAEILGIALGLGGPHALARPDCGAHGPSGATCERAEGHLSETHWGTMMVTWVGNASAPRAQGLPDLDDLRRKARAATPGPWRAGAVQKDRVFAPYAGALEGPNGERVLLRMNEHFPNEADAAFIAAAHPGVVLALLDRIAALSAASRKGEL